MPPKQSNPANQFANLAEEIAKKIAEKLLAGNIQPKDAVMEYIDAAMSNMQAFQSEQEMLILSEMLKQIKTFCDALRMSPEDRIKITQSLLNKMGTSQALTDMATAINANTNNHDQQMRAIDIMEHAIRSCEQFKDMLPPTTCANMLQTFHQALEKDLLDTYRNQNNNNNRVLPNNRKP